MSSDSDSSFGEGFTTNLVALNLDGPTLVFPQVTNNVDEFYSSSDDSGDEDDNDGVGAAPRGNAGNDSSEDDEWGTIRGGNIGFTLGSSSSSETKGDLFLPEPIFSVESLNRKKPEMPYLSKEDLPPGSQVWVVDEEDVQGLLRSHWDPSYDNVCNGKRCGTVVRHIQELTLVKFENPISGVTYCLSIPRVCLSLSKIQPYDCVNRLTQAKLVSSTLAKTGSSIGSVSRISSELCFQFYESLSAMGVSSASKSLLGLSDEKFRSGHFLEALEAVNKVMESEEMNDSDRLESLLLRSRILIFLCRFSEALQDAMEAVRLEPKWVRGYLAAARAYTCLGDFSGVSENLCFASAILPYSAEVESLKELNRYMMSIYETVGRAHSLLFYLDSNYRKRLLASRDISPGETILVEGAPIVAIHSSSSEAPFGRCCVCYCKEHTFGGEDDSHGDRELLSSHSYCSEKCQKRASLFLNLEDKHKDALLKCKEILEERGSHVEGKYSLEVANLTLRLFFIVISTHKRLSKTLAQEKPARLEDVLELLGVFPLVTSTISSETIRVLVAVHSALTVSFKAEDKKRYSADLFCSIFNYINSYFLKVDLSAYGTHYAIFILPRFITCPSVSMDRCRGRGYLTSIANGKTTPNCKINVNFSRTATEAFNDSDYVMLVSTQNIAEKDELLTE